MKYKPETVTIPKLVSGQTGWVWLPLGGEIKNATVNTVGNKEIVVLIHKTPSTSIAAVIHPSRFLAKDY